MSTSFDKLRKRVLEEVRQQRQKPLSASNSNRTRVFGLFLQECLHNSGYSRSDFARALDMEPELADAILEGHLPPSEFNEVLLGEIAQLLNYDVRSLKIILDVGVDEADIPHPQDAARLAIRRRGR